MKIAFEFNKKYMKMAIANKLKLLGIKRIKEQEIEDMKINLIRLVPKKVKKIKRRLMKIGVTGYERLGWTMTKEKKKNNQKF